MDDFYQSDEGDGSDTYAVSPSQQQSQPSGRPSKNTAREEGPACLPCRRKKSKCSRRLPCSHCVKYSASRFEALFVALFRRALFLCASN